MQFHYTKMRTLKLISIVYKNNYRIVIHIYNVSVFKHSRKRCKIPSSITLPLWRAVPHIHVLDGICLMRKLLRKYTKKFPFLKKCSLCNVNKKWWQQQYIIEQNGIVMWMLNYYRSLCLGKSNYGTIMTYGRCKLILYKMS